jgi:membrane protein
MATRTVHSASLSPGWTFLPAKTSGRSARGRRSASLPAILRQAAVDWLDDKCPRLAAAMACYVVLSLAPLIVITFKLVTLALADDSARQLITSQLHNLLGNAASDQLIESILEAKKQQSGVLAAAIGIGILLFGASGVFGELQSSLNSIWEVKAKAHGGIWRWLRSRFLSITMVLGLGFLLLVSFFVSTVLSAASRSLLGDAKPVGIILDLVLSMGTITLMMACIYKFLPDVKILWKDVWLGAFVTALLFIAGKWGLTLYFQFAAPSSAYGFFGSLAAVIIWVYYAAQILFFGAEFTQAHATAHGRAFQPGQYAEAAPDKNAP